MLSLRFLEILVLVAILHSISTSVEACPDEVPPAMPKPLWVKEYEPLAQAVLPKDVWDYFSSGADTEFTTKNNEVAYTRYTFRPRILADVATVDISTKVLGVNVTLPLGFDPTAMQRLATPRGELETAKVAALKGLTMILSSLATTSMRDVAKEFYDNYSGKGQLWVHGYITTNRSVMKAFVDHAKEVGFKAFVLSVDQPYSGFKRQDIKNDFKLPPHITYKLLEEFGTFTRNAQGDQLFNGQVLHDAGACWEDLKLLKSMTDLKIILKGVLNVQDAVLAAKAGVDGIIVSNHGGRQLDFAPPTINILREIVEAVNGTIDVYLDGGIRTGSDVAKAVAMGAKSVFMGRPMLWGLAHNASTGLEDVVSIFERELKLVMGLLGASDVSELVPEMVKREPL